VHKAQQYVTDRGDQTSGTCDRCDQWSHTGDRSVAAAQPSNSSSLSQVKRGPPPKGALCNQGTVPDWPGTGVDLITTVGHWRIQLKIPEDLRWCGATGQGGIWVRPKTQDLKEDWFDKRVKRYLKYHKKDQRRSKFKVHHWTESRLILAAVRRPSDALALGFQTSGGISVID